MGAMIAGCRPCHRWRRTCIPGITLALVLAWTHRGRAESSPASKPDHSGDVVQKLMTDDGVELGLWGRIDETVQPTLIVLASTIDETLANPYFRQCGNQLAGEAGWLCVSIDLPCHGTQRRAGETEGLSGWRERVEKGEDFVAAFNTRLAGVLDFLIDQEYSDPRRIVACGTSRGGYLALQFAAFDHRVGNVCAFAPVTDLAKLSEFGGMEDDQLTGQLSVERRAADLAGRGVWIVIGDQDVRVSTDSAIHLARQLTASGSVVELHVVSEPRGHTTPRGASELAAKWILSRTGNQP